MSPDAWGKLTVPQLSALLANRTGDEEDFLQQVEDDAFDRFDAVCDKTGLTPHELPSLSDPTLRDELLAIMPEKQRRYGVDAAKMRTRLALYVEACR